MKKIFILILLVFLTSCSCGTSVRVASQPHLSANQKEGTGGEIVTKEQNLPNLRYVIDTEHNTICYVFNNRDGIFCKDLVSNKGY
jgi:hypothetical protein